MPFEKQLIIPPPPPPFSAMLDEMNEVGKDLSQDDLKDAVRAARKE